MNIASRIYGEYIRRSNFCDTGVQELEKKKSSTEKKIQSDHKLTKFCEGYGK